HHAFEGLEVLLARLGLSVGVVPDHRIRRVDLAHRRHVASLDRIEEALGQRQGRILVHRSLPPQPSTSATLAASVSAIWSISASLATNGGPRQMMSRTAPVPPG